MRAAASPKGTFAPRALAGSVRPVVLLLALALLPTLSAPSASATACEEGPLVERVLCAAAPPECVLTGSCDVVSELLRHACGLGGACDGVPPLP